VGTNPLLAKTNAIVFTINFFDNRLAIIATTVAMIIMYEPVDLCELF
jgi:hypothetical protein